MYKTWFFWRNTKIGNTKCKMCKIPMPKMSWNHMFCPICAKINQQEKQKKNAEKRKKENRRQRKLKEERLKKMEEENEKRRRWF